MNSNKNQLIKSAARGMSLLEIMVVITLIGLVTAAVGVAVGDQASNWLVHQDVLKSIRQDDFATVKFNPVMAHDNTASRLLYRFAVYLHRTALNQDIALSSGGDAGPGQKPVQT